MLLPSPCHEKVASVAFGTTISKSFSHRRRRNWVEKLAADDECGSFVGFFPLPHPIITQKTLFQPESYPFYRFFSRALLPTILKRLLPQSTGVFSLPGRLPFTSCPRRVIIIQSLQSEIKKITEWKNTKTWSNRVFFFVVKSAYFAVCICNVLPKNILQQIFFENKLTEDMEGCFIAVSKIKL